MERLVLSSSGQNMVCSLLIWLTYEVGNLSFKFWDEGWREIKPKPEALELAMQLRFFVKLCEHTVIYQPFDPLVDSWCVIFLPARGIRRLLVL